MLFAVMSAPGVLGASRTLTPPEWEDGARDIVMTKRRVLINDDLRVQGIFHPELDMCSLL